MNQEQIALITKWENTKATLDKAKKEELALRKQIEKELFPNPKLGVNNLPLSEGWVLKLTAKETKSVDQAVLISVIERLPADVADKAIKVTYAINQKAMDFIDNDSIALLNTAVTTKPAPPTLTITETKR